MSRGSKIALLFFAVGIVAAAYLTSDMQHKPRRPGQAGAQGAKGARGGANAETGTATNVVHSDLAFVGSDACRECHQEIYDRYKASPMGRSIRTAEAAIAELGDEQRVAFHAGPRDYEVSVVDGKLLHAESMVHDGEPLYRQQKEIAYVLGSGQRGRSYLIHEHDRLFQSPIGWYAASHFEQDDQGASRQDSSGAWDLSPGYQPESHPRFSRVIDEGCLYCHAGRTNPKEASHDRFHNNTFHELAIGCERCHGPGQAHVDFHAGVKEASDVIVNPAKMEDPILRDNVCNQCHLLGQSVVRRRGKSFFSYRPGERLEETFVMMTRPSNQTGSRISAVSQVEQMRKSQCYIGSQEQLSCTSCHDPHFSPAPQDRIAHYRDRCLQCHQDQGCSLDESDRQREQNSCVACHMPRLPTSNVPHTSLTHHGIVRPGQVYEAPSDKPAMSVFSDHAERLPGIAVDRAIGISLMTGAWTMASKELAVEAMKQLLTAMPISPEPMDVRLKSLKDPELLQEIGSGYYLLENRELAELCWERLLELQPANETALVGLGKIAWEGQDEKRYKELLQQLEKVAPHSEEHLMMQLQFAIHGEDTASAIKWGERFVEVNPTLIHVRQLLRSAYQRAGRDDDVSTQTRIIDALTAQNAPSQSTPPKTE